MSSLVKSFRILSDPTRIRLVALLSAHELSVNELREITHLGQSRISTHLGVLLESDLLQSRRQGKRTFYRVNRELKSPVGAAVELAIRGAEELPEWGDDQFNLKHALARRIDKAREYFDKAAGCFGRVYGPGRSWEVFGQLLLRIVPPLEVADLGSGEGILSALLARRCRRVIAVDNSAKIVAFGSAKARKQKLKNLEFRLGDLEDPPIEAESMDLVILSQALHHATDPGRAIRSAHRILRRGGHLIILDLVKHTYEAARELYGDRILGFTEAELHRWLSRSGFKDLEVTIVAREDQEPHFETVLAEGFKPA